MMNKEEMKQVILNNDVEKYPLLNEIFAIRDTRRETQDYTIYVDGYISVDVLNKAIKQQSEIEILKRDFEIVDHECSRLEQEDIIKDMIIDLMAKYIEEQTGSCPLDMFDYKEIDCENVCKQEMYPCWIEYFKRKVENK